MEVYELSCQYDARQSFYGKARVEVEGSKHTLISYNTEVASFDENTGKFEYYGYYSQTTTRHQIEFFKQMTGNTSIDVSRKTLSKYYVKKGC